MKKAGLYIHIPFCEKKCIYCDFNSYPGCSAKVQSGYFDALESEIEAFCGAVSEEIRVGGDCEICSDNYGECVSGGKREDYESGCEREGHESGCEREDREEHIFADTLFIGGGTPSAADPAQIERIMRIVRSKTLCDENLRGKTLNSEIMREGFLKDVRLLSDDAEVTIEINPGTVTYDALVRYKKAGINRISMGVQSMNDNELAFLGRIHSVRDARKCFEMSRKAGFDNINIDLIFGFPGMSIESWRETLENVIEMRPEHISFYSLQIEEGTPLYNMFRNGEVEQIPEEDDRKMYHLAEKMLKSAGYIHYEISNAALPGKECKHNLKYWNMTSYIGFGTSAHSYINGRQSSCLGRLFDRKFKKAEPQSAGKSLISAVKSFRYYNEDDIDAYIRRQAGHRYNPINISPNMLDDEMTDAIFTGLRLMEGIDMKSLDHAFNGIFHDRFGNEVHKLLEEGMLCEEQGKIRLTGVGRDLSNYVIGRLINCADE